MEHKKFKVVVEEDKRMEKVYLYGEKEDWFWKIFRNDDFYLSKDKKEILYLVPYDTDAGDEGWDLELEGDSDSSSTVWTIAFQMPVKHFIKLALKLARKPKAALFALFVSYKYGNHYIGVYPSLEILYDVIHEMMADMGIPKKEMVRIGVVRDNLEKGDDFHCEFSDTTWLTVQKVSEQLTEGIVDNIIKKLKPRK